MVTANENGGVDALFEEADRSCDVDVKDVVCSARVNQYVDTGAQYSPCKKHGMGATDRGLSSTNHHE
jgi:hypothetical protein